MLKCEFPPEKNVTLHKKCLNGLVAVFEEFD
jgi:hypothetical protein